LVPVIGQIQLLVTARLARFPLAQDEDGRIDQTSNRNGGGCDKGRHMAARGSGLESILSALLALDADQRSF